MFKFIFVYIFKVLGYIVFLKGKFNGVRFRGGSKVSYIISFKGEFKG